VFHKIGSPNQGNIGSSNSALVLCVMHNEVDRNDDRTKNSST
jgi:hypothetical protein